LLKVVISGISSQAKMTISIGKRKNMASFKINLPRGSGVRTVEIPQDNPKAVDVTAKLAKDMHVKEDRWKLYVKPEGAATQAVAPTDKMTPDDKKSYYFYPLPR
jgi:hypothetical protein